MKSFVPSNTHSWYTPSKVDFATKNKKSVKSSYSQNNISNETHNPNWELSHFQPIVTIRTRIYRPYHISISPVLWIPSVRFLLISLDFPISVYCFTFNYWVDQCQLCNLDIKTQNTTTTNDKLIQAIWNECLY